MAVSDADLQALQDKVKALVQAKADEDAKTVASNAADSAAAQAASLASQAKMDEQDATTKTTADLNDLRSFIDGLA